VERKSKVEDVEGLNIYNGKRILVTGHTGFKGAWFCIWLNRLGAKVVGFSLKKYPNDFVYRKTNLSKIIFADERGDINDYKRLKWVFDKYRPEIIFHLAAQTIVRLSYDKPIGTLNTNIMGTINVLECIKNTPSVKAAVMVTSDKCYKNKEQIKPYKEGDELGGYDPYSCSKACAELVIDCYRKSFFNNSLKLVASVRAGNVVGGGDFGKDRLVPDCIRALIKGKEIKIRNPDSIRPWNFILDALYGYLLVGQKLLEGKKEFAGAWNFAPDSTSMITVNEIVDLVIKSWGKGKWVHSGTDEKTHETKLLNLDATKAKTLLNWSPKFNIKETIKNTVEWYKKCEVDNAYDLCVTQLNKYVSEL